MGPEHFADVKYANIVPTCFVPRGTKKKARSAGLRVGRFSEGRAENQRGRMVYLSLSASVSDVAA